MVPPTKPERPSVVRDALTNGENLYYFGLGSNMLRSKIEGRCVNGTTIELLSMEPAIVPGYRLAFNMRGFPPLEPGMGSIEPCDASSKPLRLYHSNECHGALILLTPENYNKVMRSEGVADDIPEPGYEEVIVDAFPYKSPETPVKAIALRARPNVRLAKDPAPSERYMNILKEGAAELGLKPCYQQFLANHPTEQAPSWLRSLAIHNMIFTFTVSNVLKTRVFSRLQSRLLFLIYGADYSKPVKFLSNAIAAMVIFPGASMGLLVRTYYNVTKTEMPMFLSRMVKIIEASKSAQPKIIPSKPEIENPTTRAIESKL
ncbi:hypothetical protein ACA910_000641 [Epithemia clementina (nom. ined.)]